MVPYLPVTFFLFFPLLSGFETDGIPPTAVFTIFRCEALVLVARRVSRRVVRGQLALSAL